MQLTGELKLERLVGIREEDVVVLPDGEFAAKEDKRFKLFFSQAFLKLKLPTVPMELTLGRRNFEDPRLWLYDAEMDGIVVNFKHGDFRVEAHGQ